MTPRMVQVGAQPAMARNRRSTAWPCSVCRTSGWYWTPYRPRPGSSAAATAAAGVRAVTAKPGGATVQPSPCDIHTCWVAGSPSRSTPGSVTSSVVAPYSPPPVRATSPPRPAIMSWKP